MVGWGSFHILRAVMSREKPHDYFFEKKKKRIVFRETARIALKIHEIDEIGSRNPIALQSKRTYKFKIWRQVKSEKS